MEELSELLDGIDENVLAQLEEADLTPVLEEVDQSILTLGEVELHSSEIDSIIEDLLDGVLRHSSSAS